MSADPGTRYTILTATNQSANIWICTLIPVAFTIACLLVRVVNRTRFAFHFGLDDYTLFAAWIIQVIQVGLLLKATTQGLGQDHSIIAQNDLSSIQTYTAASTVLTVISLFVIKASMILLIARLFTRSTHIYLVAVSVLGVIAAVQIEAGCVYPTCTDSAPRYYVLAAFDIATEILLFALPTYYLQDLRMNWQRKSKVLITFAARLLVLVLSGLIIWAASRVRQTGEFTTSIVLLIIFLQLELGLSICICAIIPSFRIIFQSSELVPAESEELSREPKREPNDAPNAQNQSSGRRTGNTTTNLSISYVRQPTPPPPKLPRQPAHSTQDSHDTSNRSIGRLSEGRASESSLVPSGTTGLSIKPLVQAPVP